MSTSQSMGQPGAPRVAPAPRSLRAFLQEAPDETTLGQRLAERMRGALGAEIEVALFSEPAAELGELLRSTPAVPELFSRARLEALPEALERLAAGEPVSGHGPGRACVAYWPLVTDDAVFFGCIAACRAAGRPPFTPSELSLGEELSDAAAVVLERRRSRAEAGDEQRRRQRLADNLRVLGEASRAFAAASGDYKTLLDVVAKTAGDALGERCSIRLVSDDGLWLRDDDARARPLSPALVDRYRRLVRTPPAAATEDSSLARELSLGSSMLVPLSSNGSCIGVLSLSRRRGAPAYDRDDLELARDLADRAALALESCALRRRVELEVEAGRTPRGSRFQPQLWSALSHELRSPLNGIIGFSALLHAGKAGNLNDTQRELLADVSASARHLLQLLGDVLELAELESNGLEIRRERVDLRALVADVCSALHAKAVAPGPRLDVQVSPALSELDTDARLLKQILHGVIGSAMKLAPPSATVVIRLEEGPGQRVALRLSSRDTDGASRELQRALQELHQLDAAASLRHPGIGVGLALARRAVEALGGSIDADGGAFSLELPRRTASEAEGGAECNACPS